MKVGGAFTTEGEAIPSMKQLRRLWILPVIAFVVVAGVAKVAYALDTDVVSACVNNVNGDARIVPAGPFGAKQAACRVNETAVTWGILGPKGDTGPQGPQGTQGIAGPQGLKGDTGHCQPSRPHRVSGATRLARAPGPKR